jgi:hypothetical protein
MWELWYRRGRGIGEERACGEVVVDRGTGLSPGRLRELFVDRGRLSLGKDWEKIKVELLKRKEREILLKPKLEGDEKEH